MKEDAVRKRAKKMGLPPKKMNAQNKPLSPEQEVERDLRLTHMSAKHSKTQQKYQILQGRVDELQAQVDLIKTVPEITTHVIKPTKAGGSEATAVVIASDWHYEERVDAGTVNDLNGYDLDTARFRIELFFANVQRLITAKQRSITVKNLVLALLGDFISGTIHDELMEGNQLMPAEAVVGVQELIASGIEFLLKHTDVNIIIPCHSGNHGRMTKKQRIATEKGNSLEYVMYHMLASHFKGEKRVTFMIAPGYHSYVDIAGYTIRFHHGHAIRFQGGVGGLTIPARKAIAQWNKARKADLDCFGHLHQFFYGGNFVCNGSVIGWNAYAINIKAEFEKPKQAFFLVNHGRKEITDISPVWLD